jgi:phage FluMu protein Com
MVNTLYSIRCPEDRKHLNKEKDVEYPTCGHLLAMIDDEFLYLRCPICKVLWKVKVHNASSIEMTLVPKEQQIQLESTLKVINNV